MVVTDTVEVDDTLRTGLSLGLPLVLLGSLLLLISILRVPTSPATGRSHCVFLWDTHTLTASIRAERNV